MNCGIPYRHTGCPVNNLDPRLERSRLPATTGRTAIINSTRPTIFPSSPAESARRRARRRARSISRRRPVTIKTIECAIVDKAWREGLVAAGACRPAAPDKKVAVVGSGPAASLRAAVARLVTRFDRLRETPPGSAACFDLRHSRLQDGEAHRLPAHRADGSGGRDLHYNAHVGISVPARGGCWTTSDAVALAGGAEKSRELPIPGREPPRHSLRNGILAAAEPAVAA